MAVSLHRGQRVSWNVPSQRPCRGVDTGHRTSRLSSSASQHPLPLPLCSSRTDLLLFREVSGPFSVTGSASASARSTPLPDVSTPCVFSSVPKAISAENLPGAPCGTGRRCSLFHHPCPTPLPVLPQCLTCLHSTFCHSLHVAIYVLRDGVSPLTGYRLHGDKNCRLICSLLCSVT